MFQKPSDVAKVDGPGQGRERLGAVVWPLRGRARRRWQRVAMCARERLGKDGPTDSAGSSKVRALVTRLISNQALANTEPRQ